MSSNAQAALQAAATVYEGGRGHSSPSAITDTAEHFLKWLDKQDRRGPQ